MGATHLLPRAELEHKKFSLVALGAEARPIAVRATSMPEARLPLRFVNGQKPGFLKRLFGGK